MSRSYIAADVRERVRQAGGERCGYCHSPQRLVFGRLEIDHIVPTALGGRDDEGNLCLACSLCNGYKGVQVEGVDSLTGEKAAIFNPRQQRWSDHFRWVEDGTQVEGLTSCGRVTVAALQLNNVLAVNVRRAWVQAGWHPPVEGE